MVHLTLNELRLITGRMDIKNYRNISREKLSNTLDESEHIFQNILQMHYRELQKCRIFHNMI